MNRRALFISALLLGSGLLSIYFLGKFSNDGDQQSVEVLATPFTPTSLGVEEDPDARANFERMMLADPVSGAIPAGIHSKALKFTRHLPTSGEMKLGGFARTEERAYIPRGPFNVGGRTRALAIDRSNEKVILAGGVSGGLWRTENEGIIWKRITPPEMINSVSCLVQDTRAGHTDTWYFGTGEYSLFNSARANNSTPYRGDGIFKSTDKGLTWQPLSATVSGDVTTFGSPFQYIYKLAINTANSNEDELYAATIGGIIRSADGGKTWATVLGADLLSEPPGTDLNDKTFPFFSDVSVTKNGIKYGALSTTSNADNNWAKAGIYRSEDGLSWVDITPTGFPAQYRRIVITPSPSNERVIYFLVDAAATNLWKATYLPSGNKYIWENLSANIPDFGGRVGEFDTQNGYNMLLEVHPTDENIVFMGGTNLFRSSDGFKSKDNTEWIGGYDPENNASQYPNHHADQHVLTFYSADPAKMLSGHDAGVSITWSGLSKEVNWLSLNNGYLTSQFFTIDIPKYEYSDLMVGGMQDNGTYLRSAPGENPPWDQVFSGDGSYCQTTSDGTFWYVSAQMAQIYRLTFNTKFELTGYARVDPTNGGLDSDNGYLFVNPFRLDPGNNNIMFLAGGNIIWRNSNLSQITNGSQEKTSTNWQRIESSVIPEGQITAMEISTTGEKWLLYGNSTGRLFKLTSAGDTAFDMEEITGADFPQAFISSISIDPSDHHNIMVVFSNYGIPSVFFSDDGGLSFTDISGNLEEHADGTGNGPSVRWGQLIPMKGGELMAAVGTGSGLYATEALSGTTTTWAREGADVVGYSVVPMLSYNPLDGRLAIATHGNGIFETFISDHLVIERPSSSEKFIVGAPYPNPFTDLISIPFEIPKKQIVKSIIYNAAGQQIKTLVWGTQFEGATTMTWDGTNVTGTAVVDGVYFCRIQLASGEQKTVRLILNH
ncbi:MAG: FlgD immunoglobulin-like domain containing protein [Imperialibacter sp.]|uniref:FlgD immunoglobulin-like domain containing protein n=1 Tax=Imperialibacter sp. TaxID=2038411 RepID=UPI0032EBE73B